MEFKKLSILALLTFLLFQVNAYAQEVTEEPVIADKYYAQAFYKNFSQLYWALGRLDLENDDAITNYLKINQCDVYKEYYFNEFQWGNIKEYTRKYIEENEKKFPVRFEFVQPLRLGKYDFDRKGFVLDEDYAIDGIRRFEIEAIDSRDTICNERSQVEIEGYPRGLLVELSRPVLFDLVPMDVANANKYIMEKSEDYRKLDDQRKRYVNVYNFREIYVVFNIRFFGTAGDHQSTRSKIPYAKVLGLLESIEVFDDPERKKLLYKRDYRRQKRTKEKKTTLTPVIEGDKATLSESKE
jgi:hypothetical protein